MFGFNSNSDKWYKKLKKKYYKEKIGRPYSNLFWYYDFVIDRPYIKKTSVKSHYYFFYIAKEWPMEELTNDLQLILPLDLYNNFYSALEDLYKLTEGLDCDDLEYTFEKQLVEKFKKYDDFANENYKPIEDILKNLCVKDKKTPF